MNNGMEDIHIDILIIFWKFKWSYIWVHLWLLATFLIMMDCTIFSFHSLKWKGKQVVYSKGGKREKSTLHQPTNMPLTQTLTMLKV